jgi:hypothetical protein
MIFRSLYPHRPDVARRAGTKQPIRNTLFIDRVSSCHSLHPGVLLAPFLTAADDGSRH